MHADWPLSSTHLRLVAIAHALLVFAGCGDRAAARLNASDSLPKLEEAGIHAAIYRSKVSAASEFCDICVLSLDRVVELGSESGADAFSAGAVLAATSDSAILVAGPHDAGTVQVFSSSGKLVRSFGRKGGGPSEHYSITQIRTDRPATVGVLDPQTRKVTQFTLTGTFVKSFPLIRSTRDFVIVGEDSIVAAATLRTPAGAGYPLHLVVAGEPVLSFGGEVATIAAYEHGLSRSLSKTRQPREFWAAHRIDYRIEKWNTDGQRLAVIERKHSWFDNGNARYASPAAAPPLSEIRAVEEDEQGRLWVLITVADAGWQPSRYRVRDETGTEVPVAPRHTHDGVFDSIIEVLDATNGNVLAVGRSDRRLTWLGHGFVASYEERKEVPIFTVWKVILQ